ncbi:MAG: DUF1353 domain-containing protein [Acidobacteriota bacterium]
MSIQDYLELGFDRFHGFQLLWSFFITVAVGVVGYVGATATASSIGTVRLLIGLGFLAFAGVNLWALDSVREQRELLADAALAAIERTEEGGELQDAASLKAIVSSGRPSSRWALLGFHLVADVLVLAMIWLVPNVLASWKAIMKTRQGETEIRGARSNVEPVVLESTSHFRRWRLSQPYTVSTEKWKVQVPEGFEFDMASVPRMFWPLIAPFELSIAAPLIHDFAYHQGGRVKDGKITNLEEADKTMSRFQADLAFLELMEAEGVSFLRRVPAFLAVAVFGGLAWDTQG